MPEFQRGDRVKLDIDYLSGYGFPRGHDAFVKEVYEGQVLVETYLNNDPRDWSLLSWLKPECLLPINGPW